MFNGRNAGELCDIKWTLAVKHSGIVGTRDHVPAVTRNGKSTPKFGWAR